MSEIKIVAVIGAGLMGNGITQICASAGYDVIMQDIETKFIENGLTNIKNSLFRFVKKNQLSTDQTIEIIDKISITTDLGDAVRHADIVIEAITENPKIKNEIWKEIGEKAKSNAIFASNTSSISITAMGNASNRPKYFLGMHFFNPVPLMKLLEIIRGQLTSDETYEIAKAFGIKIGKQIITVNEAPGFAVNRVLIPFILEALRAIEEGVCTPEDMDTGFKLGLNHPMGPITLLDFVGLDTTLFIADYMFDETGDRKYKAPNLLRKMVRAGLYGRKSGQGFYKY